MESEERVTDSVHGGNTQSCLTLCDSEVCSPPGSSIYGITPARILEWVAISFPRRSSWSRDWTHVSCISSWILYHWATREALHPHPNHVNFVHVRFFICKVNVLKQKIIACLWLSWGPLRCFIKYYITCHLSYPHVTKFPRKRLCWWPTAHNIWNYKNRLPKWL